jgi:hypothetical protein
MGKKTALNSSSSSTKKTKKVLISDYPPWHTVALVVGLVSMFILSLPSMASLDKVATLETVTHVNFPETFSVASVATFRIIAGSIMIIDSLHAFFYGSWEQDTTYYQPTSKLQPVQAIKFRGMLRVQPASVQSGLMTWTSFTMWVWILEGFAFVLLGVLSVLPVDSWLVQQPWSFRIAVVAWETAAPNSLLVSAVVKYVLWPECIANNAANGNNSHVLKHPCALLEHNWNVLAALIEIGIAGGLPVRYQDFSLAPLFGLLYLLFSWSMIHSWCTKDKGPQFIYPFLDTTLGVTTSIALMALLLVLTASFAVFSLADHVLTEYIGGGIGTHCLVVFLMAVCVCRVRD